MAAFMLPFAPLTCKLKNKWERVLEYEFLHSIKVCLSL